MSKDLKILQIGTENWKHRYDIPKKMEWYYFYPKTEGINIYGSMAKNTVIDGYFIGENGAVNR